MRCERAWLDCLRAIESSVRPMMRAEWPWPINSTQSSSERKPSAKTCRTGFPTCRFKTVPCPQSRRLRTACRSCGQWPRISRRTPGTWKTTPRNSSSCKDSSIRFDMRSSMASVSLQPAKVRPPQPLPSCVRTSRSKGLPKTNRDVHTPSSQERFLLPPTE